MTPTPPSATSPTVGCSPEEQFRVVRRRNRVPLSCYPCRTRKRCDRHRPCSNCTKREGAATTSCSYATPSSRNKKQAQGDSSPDDMQNRIDRLEGLVLSLMHNGAAAAADSADSAAVRARASASHSADSAAARASASASHSVADSASSAKASRDDAPVVDDDSDDDDGLAASLGILKVDTDKGKSLYFGQEHWHLILADIAEVKNYFTNHCKELETSYERVKSSKPDTAREGPTLLLGAPRASDCELRAELPPKSSVLALCSRYFNSMDNTVCIIHGPTFLRQLYLHYEDPAKTPVMWLGLLYSVLSLAMLSYHKVGDEPLECRGRTMDLASQYRLRTVQCLVNSDYTKPVEYTVETMILYIFGEYASRWDADLGLWLIVSLITRIAIRMGYHRDAKWFPSLTPFQAEMRRRTWALVRMLDVIFSHQLSLPNMTCEHDCDTQLPTNLFDDDFDAGVGEMPPPRPASDPTPISYLIAKAKLCNELGNIMQAINGVGRHVSYDEIIRFDARLRQVMQELPPHLKLGLLEGVQEPVTHMLGRFNIDILYQKIICLLHRRYMSRARQNPRYAHSRRSAIKASLQVMDHLRTLYAESRGNGRLRCVGWYVKSIATKEFILPAMLIVLDLHYDNTAAQTGAPRDHDGAFVWSPAERARMIDTLEEAGAIWKSLADTSMEAFKASKILDIMLHKIKDPPGQSADATAAARAEPPLAAPEAGMGMAQAPAMGRGMVPADELPGWDPGLSPLSGGGSLMGMDPSLSLPNTVDMQIDAFDAVGGGASPLSMFTNLGGGSGSVADLTAGFDWGAFENYAQTANWGADQSFQIFGAGDAPPEQEGQEPMMNAQ